MKVHEETWTAQRYIVEMAGECGRHLGQFIDDEDDPENPSCDRDRAQLAAQAPAMARKLLELLSADGDETRYLLGNEERIEIARLLRDAGVPT